MTVAVVGFQVQSVRDTSQYSYGAGSITTLGAVNSPEKIGAFWVSLLDVLVRESYALIELVVRITVQQVSDSSQPL
jgi:hypothetical protein